VLNDATESDLLAAAVAVVWAVVCLAAIGIRFGV
jgi:hypothetical protein